MAGRWVEVGDRVLVRRYRELDLSVGLVLGDGACLVVDTRGDAAQGAEWAGAIRTVTADPWTVVLTHAHFDHCFGTEAFLPCPVWAQRGCRAELAATAAEQRRVWAEHYRRTGQPETAARLAEVEPVLPERAVAERGELTLGARRVVLAHFGPGHTNHDLVVHVPDASVTFAGDLVEHGAPPDFSDADPLAWPAALDGVLEFGAAVVVPGHGEPTGTEFVAAQRAEVAELAALCRAVAEGRVRPGEAVRRSPFPEATTRTAIARTPTQSEPIPGQTWQ
ncbi:MBL fold metallo-hydrolase [Gandjariella thermophila]|uniref:MBL fold metallo-hydrolase n=1 Tax=Gandjariella thermophila TaxID=1931992 RepID=A0A4D4JDB1_9PSEU|nr:MBL fold metallo-hydrolase [Gandjariella thermophila]GDY32359.1 MBL fold metallo-hydrolase [Gandjariella thermophila]